MKRIFLGLALLCTLTLSCREKPYEYPVIANNCPDPSVLDNRSRDGYFYAYSTRSRIGDTLYEIPVWRSRDFVHWEIAGAAFTAETHRSASSFAGLKIASSSVPSPPSLSGHVFTVKWTKA